MARGVRQGCLASGFLSAMASDPIFRWLEESITPRNVDNLCFLRPAQCSCADDLSVASSSLRWLMVALAPAFTFCGLPHWPQFRLSQLLLGSVWK